MNRIALILTSLLLAFALSTSARAAEAVDINSADAQTLAESLNGIGMTKAQAIIAYREAHGPFQSADQLAAVKGVGLATVEKNRDRIQIKDAPSQSKARQP